MFDLLIKNAKVVDGTSAPWYYADVALLDGRIARIGTIQENLAAKVIDAKGQVLAPGFIDIHSHSDLSILEHNRNESRI
jgi:N-acyl-D-aspartate/D-glutamate deacylase